MMRLLPLGIVLAACVTAGCGSSHTDLPAAEPPVSPPLARPPAGSVVAIGSQPEGIAADPATGRVAVGLRNPDRIVITNRDGRPIKRVAVSESPRHLALERPGGPVLVPAERTNELLRVGLDGSLVGSPVRVGRFPHDASASGSRVFVANEMDHSVSVIERGRVIRELDAPRQPGGIATAGHGDVIVVGVGERALRSYDAATLKPKRTAGAGVGPTHIVSDCNERVYVADTDGRAILAYRTGRDLELADRVNLPADPYGIAVDCRRRRLWVTEPGRNRLVRLRIPRDQGQVRLERTYPTVRQPNSVATDPATGRVFVAGRSRGVLQVIDPGAGEAGR